MAIQAPRRKNAAKQRAARALGETDGRGWTAPALLILATFAVFAPVCAASFVYWDDNLNVFKNAALNPPTLHSVVHFWWDPYLDLYIPLTYTVWGLLAMMAQLPEPDATGLMLNPIVFHVANLLVHITSVIIVYLLIRRLIGPRWPAAAGAMLFAIHPLQVEPVVWVTGMKDLLSGMLALAAIWQYVCFTQTPMDENHSSSSNKSLQNSRNSIGGFASVNHLPEEFRPIRVLFNVLARLWNRKRIRHYVLALTAFVLALLSKPSAMVAPFLLLVIELGIIRRSLRKSDIWATVKPLLPMLIISVGWVLVSTFVQSVVKPADGGHRLLRPLIAADALAFYFYKLAVPLSLGIHYDHGPMTVIRSGLIYFTWIVPVALLVASIALYRRIPWLLPCAMLFVIGAAPVLGLTPFAFQRFSTVADRYVYLSMLGPALALAAFLARWTGSAATIHDARTAPAPQGNLASARNIFVIVAIVLSLLGARSFAQTFVWMDTRRLFTHSLKINPRSYDAYEGLAADSDHRKKLREAIEYANQAIAIDADRPDAYVTLGTIYMELGDKDKPAPVLEKGLSLDPNNVQALIMLGSFRGQQGRTIEGEELLRKAIKLNPDAEQAHLNLAVLLGSTKRPAEAIEEAEAAVRLDGGDALAHYCYADLLIRKHDVNAAIQQLQIAQQIAPGLPQAQEAYAWLAQVRGQRPRPDP